MPPFDHFSAIAPLYARATYSKLIYLKEYASLPVDGLLLDVGGGTGRVSSTVMGLVNGVVIADVSFGMLKETQHASRALRPVCGGSESLPFADNSFERVIMVDALHHVLDQKKSAREMFRVLKPGGVLVIEEPDIRTFGVKLIAIAEKLLVMRSHFFPPDKIAEMFPGEETSIRVGEGTAWVIIKKAGHALA
ncbi:MAG: class I SAM-dependent methyltransferase [Chloroflexi bacterium]|nr:class I SAM-dependent methyltransferase [Chloroflexota bacterium]